MLYCAPLWDTLELEVLSALDPFRDSERLGLSFEETPRGKTARPFDILVEKRQVGWTAFWEIQRGQIG